MDIVSINQSRHLTFLSGGAEDQALRFRQSFSLPPLRDIEYHSRICLGDFLGRGPAGGTVLAIANGLALDVQRPAA